MNRSIYPRLAKLATKVAGALAAVLLVTGCEPLAETWDARAEVPVRAKANPTVPADPAPTQLRVMTWNIKFGGGRIDFFFDYWGDRVVMTGDEVEANLAGLCALIEEVRPDVLVVEEIDVNSRRSAYVDLAAAILAHTHLNYAAYFPTWKSKYVPSEGLGRVDMGNAIFSVYPITFAERFSLSDRTDLDAVHAEFYLHRAVGRAVLDVGAGRRVATFVVHTEAYDTDGTKARQLDEIHGLLAAETLPWMIGGDFNAIPPGSLQTTGFNDENPRATGTDYAQPPYELDDLAPFYADYQPAITLERYGTTEAEQRRYFTHSTIGPDTIGANGEPGFWNRTLDYLFVPAPASWAAGSTDVLQQSGDAGIVSNPLFLSDHAPVVGTWVLP